MRRKHPDVRYFAPEGAGGYLVEQIRDIVTDTSYAPIQADKKVYILDRVDLLGTCLLYTSSEIKIAHSDSEGSASNNYNLGVFGDYVYPQTGYPLNTPNIGVLTAETGQIFAAGEPIHLEGYAHAFEEQVTKIEFSFDHGATWVEVPITDSDNAKWVYWKMDIDSFVEPGSYLVELRATSVDANGEEHTNGKIPNFLINVQ